MAASADDRQIEALAYVLWSYFDRTAAGDAPRAQAFLRAFQTLYTQYSPAVRRLGASSGFTLPSSLTSTGAWTTADVQPAQVVLALAFLTQANTSTVLPALERMPADARSLPSWFNAYRSALPTADKAAPQHVADLWSAIDIGSLPAQITLAVGELVSGSSQSAAPTVSFGRDPFSYVRDRAANVVTFSEELVTGQATTPEMPIWGWVALAVGGVAAAGILTWGLLSKPKAHA